MTKPISLLIMLNLCGCSHITPIVGASHSSYPQLGFPINDRCDVSTDTLGVGFKFEYKRFGGVLLGGARQVRTCEQTYAAPGFAGSVYYELGKDL